MFKVTGYIFEEGKRGLNGKFVFHSASHNTAKRVAENFPTIDNAHVNIEFELRVPLGRRMAWVDANPRALEQAAETLMEAAHNIRHAPHDPIEPMEDQTIFKSAAE